jgi:N-acetylglucosaminyldiphosphoundecaprenol N-acetyl-beta-D-mannosaminyltransferase
VRTVNYLGYSILNEPYSRARGEVNSGSIITISPNSYGLGTEIPDLNKALKAADILVLDGVYFGLGYFLRTGKTIAKNQGPDIFYDELNIQNDRGGRVFFLGSTEKTLGLISSRLVEEYPNIQFETMSPPYKEKLNDEDNKVIEEALKSFQPDVVMVGMTCPKQEIWINEQIDRYQDILFLAIGGVFDWFAGNYKELHPLWWKLRLGWLGRAIQRPGLLKRNIPYYWIYFKHMLRK